MKTLIQLLQDLPLETFLNKHFTRLPFSSHQGARDFTNLLSWDVIKNIIAEKKSVLRVVQDGKVIRDYVELNYEQALTHFRQGHTLLIRFAEKSDKTLEKLAHEFQDFFRSPVDIQLYCTPEGHNAFGWHYDVEEVFIIQASGSKHYTIRPNTVHPNPLVSSIPKDLKYETEKTPIEIQVTLKAGDWLYIPSGWWHIARSESESMHISIGAMPSSAVDLVSFLPQFLAQKPFWRTRMPLHQDFTSEEVELEFYQEAMNKLGIELAKQFSSKEFIKDFLQKKKNS